jgi:hypothetical protein
VIKITLLGKSRLEGLARPAEDADWLRTPVGMAGRLGSGPPDTTCQSCAHLNLADSKWSDRGRCALCLERVRLARGKGKIQEVPVNSASCSRYEPRPDAAAAIAAADARIDGRIVEKRNKIDDLQRAIKRLNEEIRELQLQRLDPGIDLSWSGFEPAEPGE